MTYLDAFKSYGDQIYSMDTAGIFSTYPNPVVSTLGCFFDQIIGTAVLITVIMAIGDKKNVVMPHGTCAILVSLLIIVIGCSLGFNCGYAINPARDLGPRIFTYLIGWGPQVFTAGNYFFWIPLVAPMIGSFIGTVLYIVLVSNNL